MRPIAQNCAFSAHKIRLIFFGFFLVPRFFGVVHRYIYFFSFSPGTFPKLSLDLIAGAFRTIPHSSSVPVLSWPLNLLIWGSSAVLVHCGGWWLGSFFYFFLSLRGLVPSGKQQLFSSYFWEKQISSTPKRGFDELSVFGFFKGGTITKLNMLIKKFQRLYIGNMLPI